VAPGGCGRGRDKREAWEGRGWRLIVKANYCKRDRDDRGRAKATVRYIAHRRDRDNQKVTRDLFGFDGSLSKHTAYRMIDEAPKKGRYYYRVIISPDPRREDSYKDLSLRNLTIAMMLKLEERYGKPLQFIAAIHDDHAPHRHVHALVILNGRRLTRADFAALRDHARNRALTERRFLDRRRRLELLEERSRSHAPPFASGGNTSAHRAAGEAAITGAQNARLYARRDQTRGRFYAPPLPLSGYTCPICGYYQALPPASKASRCPRDGWYLRRDKPHEVHREVPRARGFGRERALERTRPS
jgi:hypothetical protein